MQQRRRFALGVRYDGAAYHGWQRQQDFISVQEKVELALSSVANHRVSVTCAGRTDAGVHASGQVIHFDSSAERSEDSWLLGTNSNLPRDIVITWVKEVPLTFHARFSATARRYRYIIYNSKVKPGILRHAVGWYYRPLNEHNMQLAGQHLIGEHDFSAFRGSGCQSNTPMRCVHEVSVKRQRHMLIIEIRANAFLLHMVRNIVGVFIKIGEGERAPEWAAEVLASRDRRCAAMTIGPRGLYLVEVEYPAEFNLPAVPMGPFFLP